MMDPPPGTAVVRVLGPCWGITARSRSVIGTTVLVAADDASPAGAPEPTA